MEMDQYIGGQRVELALAGRVVVERFPQPCVPEIAEQQQPLVEVGRKDLGRFEAPADQPVGDGDERARILMRRRRVHQDRAATTMNHPEVAAERGVAGQRQDFGAFPAGCGKETGRMGRRSHRGGHRPSHDGGIWAVKILSPSCPNWSDRRSAPGQARAPARSGHSTSSTASAAASSPSSSISDASSIRYKSTCQTGGSTSSYGWIIAKVGLGTSPSWPSSAMKPRASAVFPTPSGPDRVITSPANAVRANAPPAAAVSTSLP